ncbi:MAG TPA: SAM-dependent methyltransferase, partial [Legionellaceae bacterium]|nr:SAM-dependent methyltransferase [Legionellaceae bacterium]
LQRGVLLIIDYGFPSHEYYHPDRNQGTLMCHYQHHAHPNPLLHIGQQDITAHVDFTHVAEAAFEANMQVSGFTSQGSFLLANGLLSLVESGCSKTSLQQHQAIKTLIQSNEMGELFKVMALTKHWHEPLRGFQMQDRRASL